MANGEGRQRLRPWLHTKLDGGNVPGVQWKDKVNGIFQIPWKHGGKQDWSETDSLIFKEWAVHTGRFRAGIDKEDWSVWKTRLRCALNKLSDIQEIKHLSKLEEPNPYRVYRFLPVKADESPHRRRRTVSESKLSPDVSVQNTSAQIPINLPTTVDGISLERTLSSGSESAMDIEQSLAAIKSEAGMDTVDGHSELVVEVETYPTDERTGAPTATTEHVIYRHEDMEKMKIPMPSHLVQPSVNNLTPIMYTCPQDHEMRIQMRYRHKAVQVYKVDNPEGCRLYYGPESNGSSWLGETGRAIYGPSEVAQLCFPVCENFMDSPNQSELTNKLLNVLDRGLVLECINGDIYATRLCRCVIFVHSASLTQYLGTTEPYKLQRNSSTKEKIFDFNGYFLPAYNRYRMGQGPKPSLEVMISFGQKWDSQTQDFRTMLISATIIHSKSLYLLHQVAGYTPSLHISASDDYDHYIDQVKEIQMTQWVF